MNNNEKNIEQVDRNLLRDNREARQTKPQYKNIDGKPLILKGVVEKIEPINARHGFSWRIKMNGSTYYYNSSRENGVEKMFEVGKPCAFVVRESPNSRKPESPYLIIQHIFYTF